MNIGTWNVQGIRQKIDLIASDLSKINVDIVALTETKKKGTGTEVVGEYIHIYTGVPKEKRAARGVSLLVRKKFKNKITNWEAIDENILTMNIQLNGHNVTVIAAYAPSDDERVATKQEFFEKMEETVANIGNDREIIMLGDFNSRTGCRTDSKVVGQYGEPTVNDNGHRLIELCETYNLKINNGFYKHKDIHRYTWIQNTRNLKTIIDYVISKQESMLRCNDVRVLRGITCGSDHYLVRAKILFPFKNIRPNTDLEDIEKMETLELPRYDVNSFANDSTKQLYQNRLDEKLIDTQGYTFTDVYENIIESLHQAAKEAIGVKENRSSKKIWWNEEIEMVIKQKKQAYLKWLNTKSEEDHATFKEIKRQARRLITAEKNKVWDKKCQDINTYIGGRKCTEVWNFIGALKNTGKDNAFLQTIKPKEWKNYYKNLLTETRQEYLGDDPTGPIHVHGEEVRIQVETVKKAIMDLKNGKASGPEGICAEMLKNGTDKLHNNLTFIINNCLNGHPVPEPWKEAYISSIHKKGDKTNCNNYRGISVTSTMSRLYGRILRNLIEDDFRQNEEEEQSGFRAGRSCTDNVFCLKQIIEKRAAKNIETHITFVDLQKAYDTVPIRKLWETLEKSSINYTLICAVQELYKNTRSRIKMGKYITEEFPVTKGLRQGCCISPTLFKIYVACALKQWKRKVHGMGVELDNGCIYTLQFADDQVVIANDMEDMQYMMRKLTEEYSQWGLTVNLTKTRYLCVGEEPNNLVLDNGQQIPSCQEYVYLGVTFDSTGTDVKEIEKRIVQAKKVIGCLNGILWSKEITKKRKYNIYETMIKSTLLYGAETWRVSEKQKKKLETVEMEAMRRSLCISRRDRIRNEVVKQRMGVEGSIIQDVNVKQLTWYGHVQRMPASRLPKQILEWQPMGRRKRGRPKIEWQKTIHKAMSEKNLTADDWEDRRRWRLGVGQRRKTF